MFVFFAAFCVMFFLVFYPGLFTLAVFLRVGTEPKYESIGAMLTNYLHKIYNDVPDTYCGNSHR